jgi:hypothetical protein
VPFGFVLLDCLLAIPARENLNTCEKMLHTLYIA